MKKISLLVLLFLTMLIMTGCLSTSPRTVESNGKESVIHAEIKLISENPNELEIIFDSYPEYMNESDKLVMIKSFDGSNEIYSSGGTLQTSTLKSRILLSDSQYPEKNLDLLIFFDKNNNYISNKNEVSYLLEDVSKNDLLNGYEFEIKTNSILINPNTEETKSPNFEVTEYNLITITGESEGLIDASRKFADSLAGPATNVNVTALEGKYARPDYLRNALLETTKPGIVNIIFVAAHGSIGSAATFMTLQYEDLLEMCRETEETELIIISACYSGSLSDEIYADEENILTLTSTDGYFAEVSGSEIGLTAMISEIFSNPKSADHNNDNLVTLKELWREAKDAHTRFMKSDKWREQAQYWDGGIPENLFGLTGDPDFVLMKL